MKPRKTQIILIVFLFIGIFIFFSFPFVFKSEIYVEKMSFDEGKVMIISDLHLDSNPRNLSCIGNFLEENDISLLILNGDLFDKLNKEEFKERFLEEALAKLNLEEGSIDKVIYILALYNHDPYLETNKQIFGDGTEILVLNGILNLSSGEESFHIFHGDYILNSIGIGVGSLINKLTSTLFFERFAKNILQIEEEWLIMGHSHVLGIDYERKIANSGCWINRIFSKTDTTILIETDEAFEPKVTLIEVPCE